MVINEADYFEDRCKIQMLAMFKINKIEEVNLLLISGFLLIYLNFMSYYCIHFTYIPSRFISKVMPEVMIVLKVVAFNY